MRKYAIDKQFGIYRYLKPPVQNAKIAGWMGSLMRPPRWIRRDKELSVRKEKISSFDGEQIELLIFEPQNAQEKLPCVVYFHGGGFFFGAAGYHYKLAKRYALETPCKIVFVQYRLAPKHPFPTPMEDCYSAFLWTVENAEKLGVDENKIAVGGDSAGGCLAAAVAQACRDRGVVSPNFQLLVYPVTDRRMETESNLKFTDTPMWNSKLSKKMWEGYLPSLDVENPAYASPMEAKDFRELAPAYIEVAEFDCLRDEGVDYFRAVHSAGVETTLNAVEGTMHGFDIAMKTPIAQNAVKTRIEYMKKRFYGK